MRSASKQSPASIREAIVASAAALSQQGDSRIAALQRVLIEETPLPGEERLFHLGAALVQAASAYVAVETLFKGDSRPEADRACAHYWQSCEEIVEEISALSACGLGGLRIKAHAVAWIESDTKDHLRNGIVSDLVALTATSKRVEREAVQ